MPHSFSDERAITDAIQTYKLASYSATLKKKSILSLQAYICALHGYIKETRY